MTTAELLEQKLNNVFSGQPWYGTAIYEIINKVTFETAFEKPANAAHNIAEILLHMMSWTEETIDRLNEKPASEPVSGDWPATGSPTKEKWTTWVDDLKLLNINLIKTIQDLPEQKWEQSIIDERGSEPVSTHAGLVNGFIEHQVYHAGQIAILTRIING